MLLAGNCNYNTKVEVLFLLINKVQFVTFNCWANEQANYKIVKNKVERKSQYGVQQCPGGC